MAEKAEEIESEGYEEEEEGEHEEHTISDVMKLLMNMDKSNKAEMRQVKAKLKILEEKVM